MTLADFYAGKTVLVTGHTGFKGSWLCCWLKLMGAEVVGYALPPEGVEDLFRVAGVEEDVTHIEGDVRDLAALQAVVDEHRPSVVLHLAAQALVRPSYRDPVGTYSTNVMGTVHLLEACRAVDSIRSVVVVTSDKCYENREWVWGYRENEPMGGHDPYSSSKGCAELVAAAYRRSFYSNGAQPVGLASARAGNVIGGGDWCEDRLIPDIMRGIRSDAAIAIRNPNATRPWQHVLEPLRGYLLLAQRAYEAPEHYGRAYNFGPAVDDCIPVGRIAEALVNEVGKGKLDAAMSNPDAPHEALLLHLDTSLARADLGWRPLLRLSDALRLTAEWYAAFFSDPSRARSMLQTQIAAYAKLSS